EPLVGANSVERDVVDVFQEFVRIDAMFLHQSGERRPMLMEMRFLDALGFLGAAAEQAFEISPHALVDQRKEASRRRVKTIVEVEDPIAYMIELAVHVRPAP